MLTKVDPAAAVAPPPDQDAPVGGRSKADPAAADAPPPEDAPVGGSGGSRAGGTQDLPTVPRADSSKKGKQKIKKPTSGTK